jgi:hypothetical protein
MKKPQGSSKDLGATQGAPSPGEAQEGVGEIKVLAAMIDRLDAYLDSDLLSLPVVLGRGRDLQRHSLSLTSLLDRLDHLERGQAGPQAAALRASLMALAARRKEAMAEKLRKEMRSHRNLRQAAIEDAEFGEAEEIEEASRHQKRSEQLERFARDLGINLSDLRT